MPKSSKRERPLFPESAQTSAEEAQSIEAGTRNFLLAKAVRYSNHSIRYYSILYSTIIYIYIYKCHVV